MRNDRNGGKRTTWLLIKHRDEFAKEGDATTSWTPMNRWRRDGR